MSSQPKPPFPDQGQPMPGRGKDMAPEPDYGEYLYRLGAPQG
jgi:hypothetical protein